MIPQADITAWRRVAPWADDAMVEQDLVLSRALVEIFSDAALAQALASRGGTALHKVVLASPSRYSEDIDLVQLEAGPIGAVLNRLRERLDPWLGKPTWERAASTVTLLYRFASEIPPVRRLRLKIEINTREHFTVYGYQTQRLAVESRWFAAGADVRTFHLDELLGTKLRALYQRRYGRDLFDLCMGPSSHRLRLRNATEQVPATLAASLAPQEVIRLPRNRDQQMSHLRVLGV